MIIVKLLLLITFVETKKFLGSTSLVPTLRKLAISITTRLHAISLTTKCIFIVIHQTQTLAKRVLVIPCGLLVKHAGSLDRFIFMFWLLPNK